MAYDGIGNASFRRDKHAQAIENHREDLDIVEQLHRDFSRPEQALRSRLGYTGSSGHGHV